MLAYRFRLGLFTTNPPGGQQGAVADSYQFQDEFADSRAASFSSRGRPCRRGAESVVIQSVRMNWNWYDKRLWARKSEDVRCGRLQPDSFCPRL